MRDENRARLGPDDVVLAAHPGSGTSWISTLLVHLGVFYASGHDERLAEGGEQATGGWVEDEDRAAPGVAVLRMREQQEHLPALRDRELGGGRYREPVRVVKTNQSAVGWPATTRALLLVRDGRDALLSLYHNLRGFSGLDVPLVDYLTGNDGAWPLPALSWAFACTSWVGALPEENLHVVRFESCRERPLEEFRAMLAFLGVERTDAEIENAIAESSYRRMREVESAEIEARGETIGRARVMRKGKVGEWRDVYTPEMLATFGGLPRRALEHFGYPTETIPEADA